MKNVLVTGGSGLVGAAIVDRLTARGYNVICPTRRDLDLADKGACVDFVEATESIDVVVHCAAVAHGTDLYRSFSTRAYNSLLFENLLSAFEGAQPRIIFLSSISVYDGVEWPSDCNHLSPPCRSEYGRGKLDDEQLLRSSMRSFAILRLAPFFSVSNRHDVASRFYIVPKRIKLKIWPTPRFQFCSDKTLIERVVPLIESPWNSISIVDDHDVAIFDDLPGFSLVLPRFLSVGFAKLCRLLLNEALAVKCKKALDPSCVETASLLLVKDPN